MDLHFIKKEVMQNISQEVGRRIHSPNKVLKLALQKAAPEMSHNFKDYSQKVCKIDFIALQIFINHETLI